MIDAARFNELADNMQDSGNSQGADAMRELISAAIEAAQSAHENRREVVSLRSEVDNLEKQLEMVRGLRYQEMRLGLPEGGHVSLRWPESMTAASAEMLREVFELQMHAHARYAERRAAAAPPSPSDGGTAP